MKKFYYVLLGLVCLLLIISFFKSSSNIEQDKVIDLEERSPYRFEQIGYFKSNQNRIFTFYVSSTIGDISVDSIPSDLWDIIRSHGSNLMHTPKRITQGLYYIERESTPDPTLAGEYYSAIDIVYDSKPIGAFIRHTSGNITFEKFPE
jgi:hypothetical protein